MRCPDCGYDADDAAIFCPQCRFRFRDVYGDLVQAAEPIIDLPDRGIIADEAVLEESPPERRPAGFSDKELLQLEVQLLQPAVLVVLIIALVAWTVLSAVPFVPLNLAGLDFGITGILCLACGLISGILFFLIARRSVVRFRSR